jgi:hypothetical protein
LRIQLETARVQQADLDKERYGMAYGLRGLDLDHELLLLQVLYGGARSA